MRKEGSPYRLVIALAAAATLAAGCGGAVDEGQQSGASRGEGKLTLTSRDRSHQPESPDVEELGSSGSVGFFVAVTEGERRPIKELYGVFSRPKNADDEEAADVAARWGALDVGADREDDLERPPGVSEEQWRAMQPGELLEDEGRLLLRGLGGEEDMVYAAPTANHQMCVALLPNGGGGCGSPGPDGLALYWSHAPTGSLVVYGLVSDEITSVAVLIAGETHVARMGENAFGIRVGGANPRELDSVVLHRRDGTQSTIPLRAPWGG